jgi:amidase
MDDYVPEVDEAQFPRKDLHFPGKEENPANAWAWKVSLKDVNAKGGLLEGKTVCLKVSGATGTAWAT